jgi:hypothetical protein
MKCYVPNGAQPVTIELSADDARQVYLEMTTVFRKLNVSMAAERKAVDIPALYQIYDELYRLGASS